MRTAKVATIVAVGVGLGAAIGGFVPALAGSADRTDTTVQDAPAPWAWSPTYGVVGVGDKIGQAERQGDNCVITTPIEVQGGVSAGGPRGSDVAWNFDDNCTAVITSIRGLSDAEIEELAKPSADGEPTPAKTREVNR